MDNSSLSVREIEETDISLPEELSANLAAQIAHPYEKKLSLIVPKKAGFEFAK